MELTLGMGIVFGLVLAAAVLFGTEWIPNDMTAIGVAVLLAVLGRWTGVTPAEAISGFASPGTITILAMFILSEGERVVRDHLETWEMREGDSLLVLIARDQIPRLERGRSLQVTHLTPLDVLREADREEAPGERRARRKRTATALGIVAAVVTVAAAGLLPIYIAALGGVFLMVVTGCLTTAGIALFWGL